MVLSEMDRTDRARRPYTPTPAAALSLVHSGLMVMVWGLESTSPRVAGRDWLQVRLYFTCCALACCVSHLRVKNACLFATLLPKGIAALPHRGDKQRLTHLWEWKTGC